MFRGEVVTNNVKQVTILKDAKIISCTKDLSKKDKGACVDLSEFVNMIGDFAKFKLIKHKISPLKKKGSYAGRSCQFYKREITLESTNPFNNTPNLQKSEEVYCTDNSLASLSQIQMHNLLSPMKGALSEKDYNTMINGVKKMPGIILYSQIKSENDMGKQLNQSMASMAELTANMDKLTGKKSSRKPIEKAPDILITTTTTTTTKVVQKTLPASAFEISTSEFNVAKKRKPRN